LSDPDAGADPDHRALRRDAVGARPDVDASRAGGADQRGASPVRSGLLARALTPHGRDVLGGREVRRAGADRAPRGDELTDDGPWAERSELPDERATAWALGVAGEEHG